MQVTRRVRFYGRVQGVYFRRRTSDAAFEIGITGWVRNLPDGSVEAEFSGEEEKVDKIIDFCSRKMQAARVDRMDVSELDYNDHGKFTIRY